MTADDDAADAAGARRRGRVLRASILRAVARLALLGLDGLVLAWLAGSILSDRHEWSQWLAWIPTPFAIAGAIAGLGLAGLLAWCVPRRRRGVEVLLRGIVLAALLAWFGLAEHRLPALLAPEPSGFRIVHWTLGEPTADHVDAFAEAVRGFDGDLTITTDGGVASTSGPVRAWLGEDARPRFARPFTVLTRHEIEEFSWLVRTDGISIAILRLAGWNPDAPADVLTVYLVNLPSDPSIARHELAGRARRLLDEAKAPPPDVVVGDFNMTRGSASLHRLFPDLRHAFSVAGRGYGATFPHDVPLWHIDHVLVAERVEASGYEILEGSIPRHRPQAAWIRPR